MRAEHENPLTDHMCGYVGFYNGKRVEVYASNMWRAKEKVIEQLRVPKSKQGLVSVVLAEVDGKQVIHSTASI